MKSWPLLGDSVAGDCDRIEVRGALKISRYRVLRHAGPAGAAPTSPRHQNSTCAAFERVPDGRIMLTFTAFR